jgi:hypothetical protein
LVCHIFCRNCLLKCSIEVKTESLKAVTEGQKIIYKQVQDDLKGQREYCKFKEEALCHSLCRTRLEEVWTAVRQTASNEWGLNFLESLSVKIGGSKASVRKLFTLM